MRYLKEMSKYSPPSDEDSGNESDDKKPKAKRAKKDPNAPKQPLVSDSCKMVTITHQYC